jgi:hypothetical protein
MLNVTKIPSVETELFQVGRRVDGQTDMMKLIVAFRNSANVPSSCTWTGLVSRCVAGRREEGLRGLHERQNPRGGKINKIDKTKGFLCSKYFKLRI